MCVALFAFLRLQSHRIGHEQRAELLELGGNSARDYRKGVIEPRHLALAIGNDEELCRFAKNATL